MTTRYIAGVNVIDLNNLAQIAIIRALYNTVICFLSPLVLNLSCFVQIAVSGLKSGGST
jgi:hypothetical protein